MDQLKNNMKKIAIFIFIMFLSFVLFGCKEEVTTKITSKEKTTVTTREVTSSKTTKSKTTATTVRVTTVTTVTTITTTEEKGMIKMTNDDYIFNNNLIEVVVNRDNGNIKSIMDVETGRDYLEESVGGNWAMLVDTSTNNPFKTNPNASSSILVSSRKLFPIMKIEEDKDTSKIIMDYDVSFKAGTITVEGISVKCIITFYHNLNEFSVDYTVKNEANIDCVIIKFTSAIVSGIKDSKSSLNLFWPNKEGKIYSGAIKKAQSTLKLSEQYPSPFSMQLVQLYDEQDSLYYYVSDNTREYKEFNFGAFTSSKEHDNGTVSVKDKISLSCTQYPYIKKGETKDIYKTTIGVAENGSYYKGSDSYRNNLINLGMNREYNKYVAEWTGFVSDTIARYTGPLKTYTGSNASDKIIEAVDHTGVDTVVLFGWHKGGFDYMYPDYEIMEGEGYGKENFKAMIDRCHENEDKVLPYLNAHITATNSTWGAKTYEGNVTNMLHAAVKKVGFNNELDSSKYTNYMYYETYGTDVGYYATCPDCPEFLEQIAKVVEELAECGADGLWMDQMMEMPANLCYDESHGHKTPATAYGEGYKKMYSKIDEIFKKYNTEYLIFAEGTTDAWIEYIDICGYMWARHLYSLDTANPGDGEQMHPDITAYTMPCSFLGINGEGTKYNHAYAYLFGSPLASGTRSMDIIVNKLYVDNPDIYFYGRYMDKRGLTISNSNVLGSVIVAENRVGIQLYNNSDNDITVTVSLDLSKLDIDKDLFKLTDLINLVYIDNDGSSFEVTIKANEIGSFGWEIK